MKLLGKAMSRPVTREKSPFSTVGAKANPLGVHKKHKKNWIAGAIKKPGALHAQLGVPQGKKIPAKTLSKASKTAKPGSTLARRLNLAKTLASFHHKMMKHHKMVQMGSSELVKEHEHLVKVLKGGDEKERASEAKKQGEELKEYKHAKHYKKRKENEGKKEDEAEEKSEHESADEDKKEGKKGEREEEMKEKRKKCKKHNKMSCKSCK